ncbi:chromosome transmission fidelity protein 18 [Turdus rufiventris]|nr:chromosome transmission fidelity protein 18 [Turdus rufiventris]
MAGTEPGPEDGFGDGPEDGLGDGPEDGFGDGPEDGFGDGPEDNFYERFAAELEVLAELEDEPFPPAGPKLSQFRSKRQRPEEPDPAGGSPGGTRDRDRVPAVSPAAADPRTPKPKRQRLEAVKKLDFGADHELAPEVSRDGGPEAPLAPHSTSSEHLEMSGMIPLQPTPPSEKRRVLRRPPVLEDYINVTSSQGSRVFLVLRDDPCGTGLQLPDSLGWNARRPLHLLGVPFSYLKEQVDEERRRQVLEASKHLTEIINNCLGSEPSAESPDPSMDTDPAAEEESASHCLWVDKFTPRRYMELLSDDYTNRCLLKWLKLWDTVVFGKDKAGKKPKPSPAANPPLSHAKEHPNKWKTKVQLTEEMLEAELDQHKRPKYKVALLCGPPGLGKTTLAHVIARHAGYNAVEMNASDDRSPEVFRTRIEAATQMRSVLGSHERPNCLIIDEIDGAPAFLHGRGQKELSVQLVQTMRIGLKDQNKGLFSIWQEIFQLPKPQRHRIGMDPSLPAQLLLGDEDLPHPGGSGGFSSSSQRFHHILQLSISSGEQDKLAQGLFENFLKMKVRDSSLGSVCLALEWLSFSDLLGRAVLQGQSFQLLRYLPFLPVAFHLLFAASSIPRLAYPSSQPEAVAKLSQMQNVLLSVVSGMAPGARGCTGLQALVLDVLSLLLDIIAPRLRPVNTQLYSLREKQQLAELISTMLTYNLTYLQERLPEGQYVFKLDPNVEAVCRFPALPARRQLSYQAKQLIAREIELEKMRRAEARNLAQDPGNGLREEPAETPSHQQRLEHIVRRAAVQDKVCGEESLEVQMGKAVGRSDVWFRFNEGFSNAVRRNLYIRDLL